LLEFWGATVRKQHQKEGRETEAQTALKHLQSDPDILEEEQALRVRRVSGADNVESLADAQEETVIQAPKMQVQLVPLNVVNRAHKANRATKALVRSIGGLPTLRKFTARFYERSFVDPHLDQFIRRHDDHHGERFALWISEKFGDGTPWTEERKTRSPDLMRVDGQTHRVAHDRSSAHVAAWHSPKRPAHKWGDHFKPDDARVWMRLHFWAARDTGLFEPQHAAFMDYYIKFIAHFISVYSSKAPPFARESARWSADQQNIERYVASGNLMSDVIDQPLQAALDDLPTEERLYAGSAASRPSWPYIG